MLLSAIGAWGLNILRYQLTLFGRGMRTLVVREDSGLHRLC